MLPLYAQKWDQVDRLIYLTWRPKHELEDEYGPEITKGLNYDTGPQQRSLQLYKSIATTSDLMLTPSVWNTGAFTGQVQGATEQHVWIKPCKSFPQGFYQRYLGESTPVPIKLTDKPVIPFTKRDGTPLWPWIHYPYESFGGRLYAQSIVDSIVQKQDQINQIDSMSQLVVQRMGNPIWREEKGQEVERFTGEPGLILRWQRTGPNSQPPDRIAGENQPQSWGQIRGEYKTDAEELSGTYDVLKGARPTGVEAYSALQLLVDRSQSRFTTLFKARARAYRDWYACAIELERQHGPTQRVQALLGPNHGWTFQTFERVDLDGDIDIHLEDGTATPKTALGRRAALEHANQLGLVQAGDSEQRYKMLQELGLSDLAPSLDADVQSALQEQDAFEQWAAAGFPQQTPNPLIRYPWDSDEVHVLENRKWMNGDAIRMLLQQYSQNPQMKAYIVQLLAQHLEEHQQALEAQQLPTSPGAPAGGPGGGAPAPGPGTKGVGGVGAARSMKNAADARVHPAGNETVICLTRLQFCPTLPPQ
jgi:hypothetical protein